MKNFYIHACMHAVRAMCYRIHLTQSQCAQFHSLLCSIRFKICWRPLCVGFTRIHYVIPHMAKIKWINIDKKANFFFLFLPYSFYVISQFSRRFSSSAFSFSHFIVSSFSHFTYDEFSNRYSSPIAKLFAFSNERTDWILCNGFQWQE